MSDSAPSMEERAMSRVSPNDRMGHEFRRTNFSLARFRADLGYDRGRSLPWQVAWFVVSSTVFQAWWCPRATRVLILRAFGASVGRGVQIRHDVRVHWPWKLAIGNDVWIGVGATLLNLEPIEIDDNVCISQEVFLSTGSHDHRSADFRFSNAPIHIGTGSWLALRSSVLAGTQVPAGVVVSAGQVVDPTCFPD